MAEQRDIKERTFTFALATVRFCRELQDISDFPPALVANLLRAGTGIAAQVDEAHGHHGKPEFSTRMGFAARDAREANYWLRLLRAMEHIPEGNFAPMLDESVQLIAILTTIVKRTRPLE